MVGGVVIDLFGSIYPLFALLNTIQIKQIINKNLTWVASFKSSKKGIY